MVLKWNFRKKKRDKRIATHVDVHDSYRASHGGRSEDGAIE